MRKELGKITSVNFGIGGYQDVMFGFFVQFQGEAWGVGDSKCYWMDPPSEFAQWTVETQERAWVEAMRFLMQTLKDAKKMKIQDLVGVPVEVTFDGQKIHSWRVLKEVL